MDRSQWIEAEVSLWCYNRDQLRHHEIFLGGHAEASCPCISCLVVLYHRLQQRHVKLYNLYELARVSQADRDTIES